MKPWCTCLQLGHSITYSLDKCVNYSLAWEELLPYFTFLIGISRKYLTRCLLFSSLAVKCCTRDRVTQAPSFHWYTISSLSPSLISHCCWILYSTTRLIESNCLFNLLFNLFFSFTVSRRPWSCPAPHWLFSERYSFPSHPSYSPLLSLAALNALCALEAKERKRERETEDTDVFNESLHPPPQGLQFAHPVISCAFFFCIFCSFSSCSSF